MFVTSSVGRSSETTCQSASPSVDGETSTQRDCVSRTAADDDPLRSAQRISVTLSGKVGGANQAPLNAILRLPLTRVGSVHSA